VSAAVHRTLPVPHCLCRELLGVCKEVVAWIQCFVAETGSHVLASVAIDLTGAGGPHASVPQRYRLYCCKQLGYRFCNISVTAFDYVALLEFVLSYFVLLCIEVVLNKS
jgi:hypothetical protein